MSEMCIFDSFFDFQGDKHMFVLYNRKMDTYEVCAGISKNET